MSSAELDQYGKYNVSFQPDLQFTTLCRGLLASVGFEDDENVEFDTEMVYMMMLIGGFMPDYDPDVNPSAEWYAITTVKNGTESKTLSKELLDKMNIGSVVTMPDSDTLFVAFARSNSSATVQVNDQYDAPISGLKISLGDQNATTDGDGFASVIALLGDYQLQTATEGVALEGNATVANKMADKVQPFSTTLKTAFSIHVDQECEISVKDSEGRPVCPETGLENRAFSCEVADKFSENNFTIEVFGEHVRRATYYVKSERNGFSYMVNKSINVTMNYFVDVYVNGLLEEECRGGNVTLFDADNDTTIALKSKELTTCATSITLENVTASRITAVVKIDQYFVKNETFDVHANSSDVVVVEALAFVEPTYALARIGHTILVFFNNTVDNRTFAKPASFTAVMSEDEEASAVGISFFNDLMDPTEVQELRQLSVARKSADGEEEESVEIKGPFLILEFNESVDTYNVVSLKFAEPENELC